MKINPYWEDKFQRHILERGRDYAYSGAVEDMKLDGDTIKAIVSGTGYYSVEIKLKNGIIEKMDCSCPYADSGNNCKHMAAVLFKASDEGDKSRRHYDRDFRDDDYDEDYYGEDDEEDDEEEDMDNDYSCHEKGERGKERNADANTSSMSITRLHSGDAKEEEIPELLKHTSQEELSLFLGELAKADPKVENSIRIRFSKNISDANIRKPKMEVDDIFMSYGDDEYGYIDNQEAMALESEIIQFLHEKVEEILDKGHYMAAFELSTYIFTTLGDYDIDDEGDEIQNISEECYELWKQIISSCSKDEYNKIHSWFDKHSHDGTVEDYLEDVLREFVDKELATEEDLRFQMQIIDKMIEDAGDSTKSPTTWTAVSGSQPAVLIRMELMKRLGSSDDEIEQYRYAHRNFREVREQYIKKAEKAGNKEELLSLLIESKELDKDSVHTVHNYSRKLVDLYHEAGQREKELSERYEDYLRIMKSGLERVALNEFRSIKALCTPEEWPKYRDGMINVTKDKGRQCRLYAEERMLKPLHDLVFESRDISLVDAYGLLLAEDYSSEILDAYSHYAETIAEQARNQANYAILTGCLRKMQRYNGGKELARDLARKWIEAYPTRKVMIQELRKFT